MPPEGENPATPRRRSVLDGLRALLRPARKRRAVRFPAATVQPDPRIDGIHDRIDRLEAMVEGLQDAFYRESVRQNERMDELQRRTEPGEVGRALSDDARGRGP